MNNLKNNIRFLSLILLLFFVACSGGNKNGSTQSKTVESATPKSKSVEINTEAQKLLDYLVETGDYVNSRSFPSMIKASSVHDELDGNIKIIDLRDPETFERGHIKGAANVTFSKLPEYFENDINPTDYDKIILACYAGQIASYATCLLRLMGYGNVYSMKWGMSSWNKDFAADWWLKKVSGKYENLLGKTINEKDVLNDLPLMNTGKSTGKEIMDARINSLFENGMRSVFINADSLFKDPHKFYVINYDRRDKYEDGHIPGAIRYKPNATLGIVDEMETIPTGKSVVTYCQTGQNSGFVTAYLRLFGYDAKSLIFGNNSFMHDKMVTQKATLAWMPFTEADVENYSYVK